MPFRRRSKDNSKAHAAIDRACIETLESRCLLTAVINGLFQGTGTPFDGGTIFEYAQPNGDDPVRISVALIEVCYRWAIVVAIGAVADIARRRDAREAGERRGRVAVAVVVGVLVVGRGHVGVAAAASAR